MNTEEGLNRGVAVFDLSAATEFMGRPDKAGDDGQGENASG